MSGFPILDLIAGIIFIYFLLSIITSSALEMILTVFRIRARLLEDWLKNTFASQKAPDSTGSKNSLGMQLIDHDLISGLSADGKSNSYIDAKNFATALIEKLTYDPNNPNSIASDLNGVIDLIKKSEAISPDLKRTFLSYAEEAKQTYAAVSEKTQSEMDLFRGKIERWFDTSMERLGGQIKSKYSRRITFVLGIIVVLALNADSIALAKYLYSNPEARTKLATQAYATAKDSTIKQQVDKINASCISSSTDSSKLADIRNSLNGQLEEIKKARETLGEDIPLGWNEKTCRDLQGHLSASLIFSKITGLLASILAIMMGAPFWFDLLNKIANLRGSGSKPEDSRKKKK